MEWLDSKQNNPRTHWFRLGIRICRLFLSQPQQSSDLITASYDSAAIGYDQAWTSHMRELSLRMLEGLPVIRGERFIDLACGTGFVTGQLSHLMGQRVVGVDASSGMLAIAEKQYGNAANFVHADILEYLSSLGSCSIDGITCAWGLGYSRPLKLASQIARVLRPGGVWGIIDNSLFSLAGVMWASLQAFAEEPKALRHVLKVRFLPSSHVLSATMRRLGLGVRKQFDGSKSFWVPNGKRALDKLMATGAAAGFEFAAEPQLHDNIFDRFAQILDLKHTDSGIAITHRYLAATGSKPC